MRQGYVCVVFIVFIVGALLASQQVSEKTPALKWTSFPDPQFEVCGMAWFTENAPELYRLPQRSKNKVQPRIWTLAEAPSGGRIRFASNTSQLKIKLSTPNLSGVDLYVNGVYWNWGKRKKGQPEMSFFEGIGRDKKEITIYLPLRHKIGLLAIGTDEDAEITPAPAFAHERPVVFYGSSVLQGVGASRPGMSYPAILCRQLNLDYVNLGFSGSGKAQPEVVSLINEIDACCFVFDLGKSFGRQPVEVYAAMLEKIRFSHPKTPMICITPIFSTWEFYDDNFHQLSLYVRKIVRQAVKDRVSSGDRNIYLVEGENTLLIRDDADAFSEGVHPTDLGFQLIADRLKPQLEKILFPSKKANREQKN